MKVAVLPSLMGVGWGGTGSFAHCTIARAETLDTFVEPRDTDAMALCYLVPGNEDSFPRLNKGALPALIEAGQEPLVHWAFLDIDNPGHVPWKDKAEAAMALIEMVTATDMGGYTTRAGLRLMAPLDPPLPASLANSWLVQFGAHIQSRWGTRLVDIDPASYEWTRLMRLPRSKRDGEVLDPVVMLDNLQPIDPYSYGFELHEVIEEAGEWGDCPPEPVEMSWQDWRHAADMKWAKEGRPVPEDENGSKYEMAKTALARIAYRGNITDPHLLASYLWESVLSTSGSSLDMDELWKLATWTADKQSREQAEDDDEDLSFLEKWPSGTATEDEWRIAKKYLTGRKSRIYASLKDGLPVHSIKSKYEEYTLRYVRDLGENTDLSADALFRIFRNTVEDQKAPPLDEVWTKCQEVVLEREDDLIADEQRLQQAFCQEYPLTLSFAGGGKMLFQLDTTTTPYSYKETSELLIDSDFRNFTQPGLPFELDFFEGTKVRAILAEYGGRVDRVAYAAGQRGCRFNSETSSMEIGVHRLAQVKPKKHDDVDTWLRLLGGSDPEGLLDWLACATYNQDQPLCSVYIEGGPGVGKSLLGKGLASLWAAPPVDYNRAMNGSFNGDILLSPVLFADEGVVVDRNNAASASLKFRDVVSSTTHTIRALYQNPVPLRGALRVLICGNDDRGLPFRDSLGSDGIEAIVQRVMYIKADPAAGDFLRALGGRGSLDDWAHDDSSPGKIAEHLMWLRDSRTVEQGNGDRFMVVGKVTDWHREFGARQGIKPNVMRVIFSYLQLIRQGAAPGHVRIRDDQDNEVVWVHPTTVVEGWDMYAKGYQAKPAHIKDALKQLSSESAVRSFNNKNVRVQGVPYQSFVDAGVCEPDDLFAS